MSMLSAGQGMETYTHVGEVDLGQVAGAEELVEERDREDVGGAGLAVEREVLLVAGAVLTPVQGKLMDGELQNKITLIWDIRCHSC